MTLPRSLDDLAGLRAARWTRESTAGQYDAFGPDAQREQQNRAIERYGLADSGVAWTVAHSGWKKLDRHPAWAEMLAGAGRDFDVLVVGYASRFARSLEAHVDARRAFHSAGAAILFADERILSSDDEQWEHWAREIVESEAYSRRLARRIREGYAAKRRRLGEPGGRPPFGFVRRGRPPRLAADDDLVRVRESYRLSALGHRDRDIAAAVELPLDTVRGILTNPIYVGRLRDGTAAAVDAVVDEATWSAVQARRRARATRGGGRPATRHAYALPMLRCAACGRRLIGDAGRYRHLEPCTAFTAARRRSAFRNRLVRTPGHSYPAAFYEDLVSPALAAIALSARDLVDGAAWYATQTPPVDELALRRLAADRDRALARYARDRDVVALERSMQRLDEQEHALRNNPRNNPRPDWHEVLELVRDMPAMWADPDAQPPHRRALAVAAFESIDALGARQLTITTTPAAGGVQAVVMVGATGFDPEVTITRAPWLPATAEQAFA